jgi:hypothetical protein
LAPLVADARFAPPLGWVAGCCGALALVVGNLDRAARW